MTLKKGEQSEYGRTLRYSVNSLYARTGFDEVLEPSICSPCSPDSRVS